MSIHTRHIPAAALCLLLAAAARAQLIVSSAQLRNLSRTSTVVTGVEQGALVTTNGSAAMSPAAEIKTQGYEPGQVDGWWIDADGYRGSSGDFYWDLGSGGFSWFSADYAFSTGPLGFYAQSLATEETTILRPSGIRVQHKLSGMFKVENWSFKRTGGSYSAAAVEDLQAYVTDSEYDQTGVKSATVRNIWTGTQAEYDALTPDPDTLYFIQ